MSGSLLDYGLRAHQAELCVLPPREDGSKRPIGDGWERYQETRPTEDDIRQWYGPKSGIGYVCGKVSGSLEMFEAEDRTLYAEFKQAAAAAGLGELLDRIESGYCSATPGGGIHLLYRCPEIAGNQKLARRPKRPEEMAHSGDRVKVLLETRGEGGYTVEAPSNGRVHTSGKPYELLSGSVEAIATVSPQERADLHDLARAFDVMPKEEFHPRQQPQPAPLDDELKPGEDFNRRASWAEVLEPAGWRYVFSRGEVDHWRRPGKNRGTSATTNWAGSDLFYAFSTSTEFEAERGYSKFRVYTILHHGGDFQAAARDLASRGYGSGPTLTTSGIRRASPVAALRSAPVTGNGHVDDGAAGPPPDDPPETDEHPPEPQRLADFARLVHNTLGKKKAGRWDKLGVSETIGAWLSKRGRLLLDDTDEMDPKVYLLDEDGAALPLDNDLLPFRSTLAQAGLNPTEPMFKWLVADLQTRAVNGGARHVRLSRWIVQRDRTLYISCGPREIVVARDGAALTIVRNGADGVLFASDATLPRWRPTEAIDPLDLAAFQVALEAPGEISGYTADVQRRHLRHWLIALSIGLRPLPMLMAIGPKGAGKSTLTRAVATTLLGEIGDLADPSLDARDFMAGVTGSPIFGIDNLDAAPAPWMADAIASAITGNQSQRRQLFSDAKLIRRPVTAALMVTTRSAGFIERPDLLERLLPLFVADLPDGAARPDRALRFQVIAYRDGVLSWLASAGAYTLARLDDAPNGLPSRFQDLARVAWTLDREHAADDMALLEQVQVASVTDQEPLLAAILAYLPPTGLKGNAVDIVRSLGELGAELPFLGGGKAIARRFRELRSVLKRVGVDVYENRRDGGHTDWLIVRRKVAESAESAESTGSYADTRVGGNTGEAAETANSADSANSLCVECGNPTNNPDLERCLDCRIPRGEVTHPETGRRLIARGLYEGDNQELLPEERPSLKPRVVCLRCNDEFTPSAGQYAYCSDACRDEDLPE